MYTVCVWGGGGSTLHHLEQQKRVFNYRVQCLVIRVKQITYV